MRARVFAGVLFCALVLARPGSAEDSPAGLPPGATLLGAAEVIEIVDGDTVLIRPPVNGLSEVRLTGLQAPKLALGRAGFKEWPLAHESKAALAELVLGRRVKIFSGGASRDRHGRALAHLAREDDGLWVQGEMLRRGWARVYTFADNRWAAADMLRLEAAARTARAGVWAHPFYAVRAHYDLKGHEGAFQLVEGRVQAAETVKGRTYLNFGADWRTDFTVYIESRNRKVFKQAGFDAAAMIGVWVRARGWLHIKNGYAVRATHPEQIEILD
ncbi:MAG: thermonuclease family protein [Rhodospirillales bacterium]